jgi:CRP/FNR family transcriptional regulator, cyclic AMP receptor protein
MFEKIALLRSSSLFCKLPDSLLEFVSDQCELLEKSKLASVYQQDTKADAIFYTVSGFVRLSMINSQMQMVTKRIVFPGQIFGEQAFICNLNYSESASVMGKPATIIRVPVSVIADVSEQSYEFYVAWLAHTANRLKETEQRLIILLNQDVRERILCFLKEYLSNKAAGKGMGNLLENGLTQQDIAHMVGSTRQTVASILNELRDEKRIEFSRKQFRWIDQSNFRLSCAL